MLARPTALPARSPAPLVLSLLALCLGTSCTCMAPPRTDLPTYLARRASSAPTIDGELRDWAGVPPTERFVDTMSGGPVGTRASARMQWDDRALYVAFEIRDTFLSSAFTARDEHLWEADCAELMIDRGGDGLGYAELQVSPTNVVFDTWFESYRAPPPFGHVDWDAELESAVRTHGTPNDEDGDDGYDVEIAIPWASLAQVGEGEHPAPHAGEEWRVALYVLDLLRDGATGSGWSPPLVGDFHVPERFGRVVLTP